MAVSKAKRASTSVKSPKSAKSAPKKDQEKSFWLRTRFVFYVVLVAAALLAISMTLAGYSWNKNGDDDTNASASATAGTMFLQSLSAADSHKVGDVVEVTLYEDSGKQEVNALQSSVKYPAEKLALVSIQNSVVFSEEAATDTATPGLIRVARSIKPGATSVKGAKPVVTIQFKVLQDSDTSFQLSVDQAASLLVRASDSKNILNEAGDNNTTFDL